MYQSYDEKTANTEDKIAWALCQIIDDDAPLVWTRYRLPAEPIDLNSKRRARHQVLGDKLGRGKRSTGEVA